MPFSAWLPKAQLFVALFVTYSNALLPKALLYVTVEKAACPLIELGPKEQLPVPLTNCCKDELPIETLILPVVNEDRLFNPIPRFSVAVEPAAFSAAPIARLLVPVLEPFPK